MVSSEKLEKDFRESDTVEGTVCQLCTQTALVLSIIALHTKSSNCDQNSATLHSTKLHIHI